MVTYFELGLIIFPFVVIRPTSLKSVTRLHIIPSCDFCVSELICLPFGIIEKKKEWEKTC